jgi:hypothetical protein
MASELPSVKDEARVAAAASNTQLLERAVLLLLFGGLLVGILAVLLPFTTAILFGAILAIAGWPLRDFLLRCGLKRGLAATLLLLLALALIALPMMAVAPGLAEQLTQGAARLQDYFASSPQAPSWLAGLPIVGARLARIWENAMSAEGGIRALLEPYSTSLRQVFVAAAGALAASVLQIILSLVVAAVFWVSGDVLAARLREFLRQLCGETAAAELDVAAGAVRGVAYGVVGTAVIQAVVMPGRRGNSGGRPAWLCHAAACAQPDRRAIDRGGLGWCGGLAVWPGPTRLGHFSDRVGSRRLDDGQCRQALADRLWRSDADEPDDPGRVRRLCFVWLSRPVHRTNTNRRRVHPARGLARRVGSDAAIGHRMKPPSASPAMVHPVLACAAAMRERSSRCDARVGRRRWAGSSKSFLQ